LHTDEYIEGVARDELGLVKPGEYIYKGVESPKE
ncbi:FtsB family cell division protein, partial [Tepidanaerobacter acetatoxydans]